MDVIETLRRKFNRMKAELDERACRVWAATEALELGHGGIQAVAVTTQEPRPMAVQFKPNEAEEAGPGKSG